MADFGYKLFDEDPGISSADASAGLIEALAKLNASSGAPPAEGKDADISAASVNADIITQGIQAETSLLVGGDMDVMNAVAASRGVGVDDKTLADAVSEFTQIAQQAVANGLPIDQVRFANPALSGVAQEAIYEQVAQRNGTSAAQIEEKYAAQKQAELEAVQNLFGGLVGGAAAKDAGPSLAQELLSPTPLAEQETALAAPHPFAGLLAGQNFAQLGNGVDIGTFGVALNNEEVKNSINGGKFREQSAGLSV